MILTSEKGTECSDSDVSLVSMAGRGARMVVVSVDSGGFMLHLHFQVGSSVKRIVYLWFTVLVLQGYCNTAV